MRGAFQEVHDFITRLSCTLYYTTQPCTEKCAGGGGANHTLTAPTFEVGGGGHAPCIDIAICQSLIFKIELPVNLFVSLAVIEGEIKVRQISFFLLVCFRWYLEIIGNLEPSSSLEQSNLVKIKILNTQRGTARLSDSFFLLPQKFGLLEAAILW